MVKKYHIERRFRDRAPVLMDITFEDLDRAKAFVEDRPIPLHDVDFRIVSPVLKYFLVGRLDYNLDFPDVSGIFYDDFESADKALREANNFADESFHISIETSINWETFI